MLILQRLASRESGIGVMPPFDLVAFTELPAEQHDPAASLCWKIDQAACVIFQLYACFIDLGRDLSDLIE